MMKLLNVLTIVLRGGEGNLSRLALVDVEHPVFEPGLDKICVIL